METTEAMIKMIAMEGCDSRKPGSLKSWSLVVAESEATVGKVAGTQMLVSKPVNDWRLAACDDEQGSPNAKEEGLTNIRSITSSTLQCAFAVGPRCADPAFQSVCCGWLNPIIARKPAQKSQDSPRAPRMGNKAGYPE